MGERGGQRLLSPVAAQAFGTVALMLTVIQGLTFHREDEAESDCVVKALPVSEPGFLGLGLKALFLPLCLLLRCVLLAFTELTVG